MGTGGTFAETSRVSGRGQSRLAAFTDAWRDDLGVSLSREAWRDDGGQLGFVKDMLSYRAPWYSAHTCAAAHTLIGNGPDTKCQRDSVRLGALEGVAYKRNGRSAVKRCSS